MKRSSKKINLLYVLICVLMLIGCDAGSSEKVDAPTSEVSLSEEVRDEMTETDRSMDDTYYVADVSSILMLCKGDDVPGYVEAIQLLKGDKDAVEKAIERLSEMEQVAGVMNAIGVGYIRLDRCEEARKILNEAMEIADDTDRVCILNNLGNSRLLVPDDIINNTITKKYEQALEIAKDPVDRIILRIDQLGYGPFVYLDDDDWEKTMAEDIAQLLKEEKELLGSNQIAGIYGYLDLAMYALEDMEVEDLNKAIELNGGRYKAADIVAYTGLVGCYHQAGDIKKALEYAEKRIEAVEGFLSETDYDYVVAYFDKGVLLVREKKYDEALQCMSPLLVLEGYRLDLKAMVYLKIGEAYHGKGDFSKAEKMVKEAYDFFDQYKKERGYDEWDIDEMLKQHDGADYNESDPDYMQWVWDQLQG